MTRGIRFAGILTTAGLLLLGTACNKRGASSSTALVTTMPVSDTKDESGWPVYDVKNEGFAVSLPPNWRRVDMNPQTFEAAYKEAMKQNPQLESMYGNLRQQMTNGVKFFGFDPTTAATGFNTNINVLRLPLPPGGTLDSTVADTLRETQAMPTIAQPIAHERLKLPSGDRERLRYKMTMNGPNGQPVALAITQFILVNGKDGFAVTLTTTASQEAHYNATFDQIGRGVRFTK